MITTAIMMVYHTIPGIDFTTVLVGSSGFTSQGTFIITILAFMMVHSTWLVHEVITTEGFQITRAEYEKNKS